MSTDLEGFEVPASVREAVGLTPRGYNAHAKVTKSFSSIDRMLAETCGDAYPEDDGEPKAKSKAEKPAAKDESVLEGWISLFLDEEEVSAMVAEAANADAMAEALAEAVDIGQAPPAAQAAWPAFLTALAEANPWHSARDGKFVSKASLNAAGKGSLSLKGHKISKSKVKNGKPNGNPNFAKTPSICGRPARMKGDDIRCWTGTRNPEGDGRLAKNDKARAPKKKKR